MKGLKIGDKVLVGGCSLGDFSGVVESTNKYGEYYIRTDGKIGPTTCGEEYGPGSLLRISEVCVRLAPTKPAPGSFVRVRVDRNNSRLVYVTRDPVSTPRECFCGRNSTGETTYSVSNIIEVLEDQKEV